MDNDKSIEHSLSFLEKELILEIMASGDLRKVDKETVLIREGQYIKQLPIIVDGIVKVYSQFDDKELLLYYIKPKQSCIISFSAAIYNQPSKIFAITEEESTILLVPSGKVNDWISRFPRFNQLFFDLYHHRYLELLETINQLVFNTLDHRILKYLKEKSSISQEDFLDIRHHQIAKDLGTAREVVSRIMKRLENEGSIQQSGGKVKVL